MTTNHSVTGIEVISDHQYYVAKAITAQSQVFWLISDKAIKLYFEGQVDYSKDHRLFLKNETVRAVLKTVVEKFAKGEPSDNKYKRLKGRRRSRRRKGRGTD